MLSMPLIQPPRAAPLQVLGNFLGKMAVAASAPYAPLPTPAM
jgi:hypothetical protein